MAKMTVDLSKSLGAVKPMHATNNGPVGRLDIPIENEHAFKGNGKRFMEAGIPYARTHDSSFYPRYGMEHTVDVYYVFPDFSADPYDPKSYDFTCTDHYLKICERAGVKVFYRLGHRIEHEVKRYGTFPPEDPHKWAVICEHIIRHYNEGWADGYHMGITYWEIWNEPDLHWNRSDIVSPTWGGTPEQYFELYNVSAEHLKSCFPDIKVGGPALASDLEWADAFLANLKAPLDFFSWHRYACTVEKVLEESEKVKALLEKHGLGDVESILNEWNYVRGWDDDNIVYSHEQKLGIKGAAFTLAVMCACQYSPVDMLMYYDARPTIWNGMFDSIQVGKPLKGYYPFVMFNELYRLGECAGLECDEEYCYGCAASNGEEAAVVLTRFCDGESTPATATVELNGFGGEKGTELEVLVLDGERTLDTVFKTVYCGERFTVTLDLPNYTSYLLKLRKL